MTRRCQKLWFTLKLSSPMQLNVPTNRHLIDIGIWIYRINWMSFVVAAIRIPWENIRRISPAHVNWMDESLERIEHPRTYTELLISSATKNSIMVTWMCPIEKMIRSQRQRRLFCKWAVRRNSISICGARFLFSKESLILHLIAILYQPQMLKYVFSTAYLKNFL